jgi:hypothetical protein
MTEATAWQYRFFVPHDIQGLINMYGGKEPFTNALDSLFTAKSKFEGELSDLTGLIGQYAHGNEPSHHMAYLYSFVGQPWKTQYWVHQLQNKMYNNTPEGISGNEDCGQMSAWHVISSLGFYPVCPGSNQYILTTPRFTEIKLQLGNGKTLLIETNKNPQQNIYIKRVLLNGDPLNAPFITHEQLTKGGVLSFELSPDPQIKNTCFNKNLIPFSLSHNQQVSVPFLTKNVNMFMDSCLINIGVATSDAEIFFTLDGSEPTKKSTKYNSPFTLKNSCKIKSRAFKNSFQPSPILTVIANKAIFIPAIKGHPVKNHGVYYKYFEGQFSETSDLDKQKPIKEGLLKNFSLHPARQKDHFGFQYKTFIKIPADGLYEFYTISDDGSVLWVDGHKVVDNDGGHAAVKATGTVALKKGVHQINLNYFEDYEGESLEVGLNTIGRKSLPFENNELWY